MCIQAAGYTFTVSMKPELCMPAIQTQAEEYAFTVSMKPELQRGLLPCCTVSLQHAFVRGWGAKFLLVTCSWQKQPGSGLLAAAACH